MNRRKFLQTSATSAAAASLPAFSIGQTDAGKKLNAALIVGGGIAKTAFSDCRKDNYGGFHKQIAPLSYEVLSRKPWRANS